MVSSEKNDLPDIRNFFFDKAEQYWWIAFWIALGAQILLVSGIWIENIFFLLMVVISGVLLPVVVAWLREMASDYSLRGDKCRRLILYDDGFGRSITREDMLEVKSWVMDIQMKEAPFVKPYYTSRLAPGPSRLADITAESAFFTEKLSRRVIDRLWIVLSLPILLLIIVLMSGDLFPILTSEPNDGFLKNVAKSVAIIVAFLISGDFAVLLKKYYSLRNSARDVFRSCIRLRGDKDASELDVISVVEDYHLSLIQSPPIPSSIYFKYKDGLNEIYQNNFHLDG